MYRVLGVTGVVTRFVGLFVTGIVGASNDAIEVVMGVLSGGVDQQRHPGLLAVRVWVTGLGGAFACNMSLFATFETGIGAAEVCSFFVGKFSELRRLSLGSEGINLYGGRGVAGHAQGIQLHRFAAGVFLMKGLRGGEGWSMIDDGVETVRNSTSFFKGLRISEFDFGSCLGF